MILYPSTGSYLSAKKVKPSTTTASPTSRGVDGGVAALSGFLYQMLGCAAIRAAAYQDQLPTGTEYDVLVSLTREKNVYQEVYDQDVVLKPLVEATDQGTVLVQFKHSGKADRKPIFPGELKTIAKRLADAARLVEDEGEQVPCCYLVTNRQLKPSAAKLLEPNVPVPKVSRGTRDILTKLHAVEKFHDSRWLQILKNFAVSYGSLTTEIEEGIGKIVARLFQQGASLLPKLPLHLEHLVEAFTGDDNARPLVRSALGEQMKEELRCLAPKKCGTLVRREILAQVEREALDRALIVFTGGGGMGKTASLHAWAEELSRLTDGPLIAATTTRDLPDGWSDHLLSQWRNLHASGREKLGFDRMVKRLEIANPRLPRPILHVCLDGLDEHAYGPTFRDRVGKIIRWFLRQDCEYRERRLMPTVRLVVTCRSKDQFSRDWLSGSSGFSGENEDPPPTFDFGPFSEGEFGRVVRDNLLPSLHDRLLARMRATSTLHMTTRSLDDGPVGEFPPTAKPTSDELIKVLHDPAMWRSFLDLDPTDREAVIDSDPKARRKLGIHFVKRFCDKLEKRTMTLKEADVLPTLRHIATIHRNSAGKYLTVDDWTRAGREPAILDPSQVRELLAEARSGGLVNDNDFRQWQWRNNILEECLLAPPNSP